VKAGPSGQTPREIHLVSGFLPSSSKRRDSLTTHLRFETTSESFGRLGYQSLTGLSQFKDTPGMDFSDAEAADPTQVLEVVESRDGVEYQVK
jgi:hypothetical protein